MGAAPITTVQGYAAFERGGRLLPFTSHLAPPRSRHIVVRPTHCAICHSDIHLIDDDWGISKYPLTPGHEIIGEVVQLGSEVKSFSIGDRVGIGWQCGACFQCGQCDQGLEQHCTGGKLRTCVDQYGGLSDAVMTDCRFAYSLPTGLDAAEAAPLMCAGLTVYAPLARRKFQGGAAIGVIGLGGLGHLAVRFAAAMGYSVAVFDIDPAKEAIARILGADRFYTTDPTTAHNDEPYDSLDFILSTAPADIDWQYYFDCLTFGGELCVVGVPSDSIRAPIASLQDERKTISGSIIGSRTDMTEMLKCADRHKIKPMIEKFTIADLNHAIDRVRKGSVQFRAVIEL